MVYAFATRYDNPHQRTRIRLLIENEQSDALARHPNVIHADNAINKSERDELYLCVYCGAEVKRLARHGPSYFAHIRPHNCDFPRSSYDT